MCNHFEYSLKYYLLIIPLTPDMSLWIPIRNKAFNAIYLLHMLHRLFAGRKYMYSPYTPLINRNTIEENTQRVCIFLHQHL